MLFDFSLSRRPVENVRSGTARYIDPFLRNRKPVQWDLYAERFAAAVTLYEMATARVPTWGDGASDPTVCRGEATLDSDRFDRGCGIRSRPSSGKRWPGMPRSDSITRSRCSTTGGGCF